MATDYSWARLLCFDIVVLMIYIFFYYNDKGSHTFFILSEALAANRKKTSV